MIKQPLIDLVYKTEKYSKKEKQLIKDIVGEVFDKHYLKDPEDMQDALMDFLGTIEISIKRTKEAYCRKILK